MSSSQVHHQTSAPSRCPMGEGQARFDPHYREDLYAALAARRTAEPVFFCEEIGYWVVTKYKDVLAILRDTDRFSAQNATTRLTPMHETALRILRDGNFTPEVTQV